MLCTIDGITHRGEGVGRIEGKAVFIPYTIPGETVEIEITEENKSYYRGRLLKIIEPSDQRIDPDCPHFYDCGGCAYQHMTYEKQLQLKRQIVLNSLQRIGKIKCDVKPVLGLEDPWRYRNKVEWHLENNEDKVVMGYYKQDSHELIEIKTCKLISQEMEDLSHFLKNRVSAPVGKDCSITIRQSSVDGLLLAVMDELKTRHMSDIENYPKLKAVYDKKGSKIKLRSGNPGFEEQVNGLRYQLAPLSFFQVNLHQTRVLYDLVLNYCDLLPGNRVLDAFCGVGSISLYLASYAKKVVGVESYAPAIANAKENAKLNNIRNCEFLAGPCETVIPQLKQKFDVVVLDPPRSGCKPQLVEALIQKKPRTIVYVSCNPSTLARDLAMFTNADYTVEAVQPVDMFPQTHHIETIVRLDRG